MNKFMVACDFKFLHLKPTLLYRKYPRILCNMDYPEYLGYSLVHLLDLRKL